MKPGHSSGRATAMCPSAGRGSSICSSTSTPTGCGPRAKPTATRCSATGRGDGVVAPGQAAAFTVVVPPLRTPGRYRLQLDMVDEQQCWFYQTGSEPLEVELTVRD